MIDLQPTTSALNAIRVLLNHYVLVYGAAMNGVCVLAAATRRIDGGSPVDASICEWVPATNKEIYNWLGY